MISRILTAAAIMMFAMKAGSPEAQNTEQTTITPEPVTLASYPDDEKIKADLIGHFMYVTDGLPGFWEFSSSSTIQKGFIRSKRQEGDLLEFNFTLFLVDNKTKEQELYLAETVIAYKQVAGTWELLTVQGNTIKKLETTILTMPNYLQNDC